MIFKAYFKKIRIFGSIVLLNFPSAAKAVNISYEHLTGAGTSATVFAALTYDLHKNDYIGKGSTKVLKSVPGSHHLLERLEKFDSQYYHNHAYQTSKVVGRYVVNGLISIGAGVVTQLVFGKVKASFISSKNTPSLAQPEGKDPTASSAPVNSSINAPEAEHPAPKGIPLIVPKKREELQNIVIKSAPDMPHEEILSATSVEDVQKKAAQMYADGIRNFTPLPIEAPHFKWDLRAFNYIRKTYNLHISHNNVPSSERSTWTPPVKYLESIHRYIEKHDLKEYSREARSYPYELFEKIALGSPQYFKNEATKLLALDYLERCMDANDPTLEIRKNWESLQPLFNSTLS